MDKQMIEEMAKIICKDGANNGDCDECGFHRKCSKFKVSEKIYNAGYRKIPENAVVLTREELEETLVNYVPQSLIDEICKEITDGKV